MAKVVSAVVLLSSATNAFIGQPITTSSRRAVSSSCSFLNMAAPGKEIEVVSQPDKEFLEKKGCVSSDRFFYIWYIYLEMTENNF